MAGRESSGNPSGEQAGRGMVAARGVKPISPKERRKLERVVEKKNEKLRSKYRAVHGKVVDWVEHWIEDAYLFVGIRFKDKTHLWLQFGAKIVADEIDLCDASDGSLRVVRQYFRREDL